jgi:hypothetical protein
MAKTLAQWIADNLDGDRDAFARRIRYSRSTVNKLCAPSVCHAPSMTLRDVVFVATDGEVDLVKMRRPQTYRARPRQKRAERVAHGGR